MTQSITPQPTPAYRIQVQGVLDESWRDYFAGMALSLGDDGTTFITGIVPDQAALYGLLRQVRDKGLTLLMVQRLDITNRDAQNPSSDEA